MTLLHFPPNKLNGSPTDTLMGSDTVKYPPTPPSSQSSRSPSLVRDPEPEVEVTGAQLNTQKKKKKKKARKSNKPKEANTTKPADNPDEDRPPVLCISRNKHWRYISSYHGPWLQLPLELLESLLILNLDPATLSATETRLPPLTSPSLGGSHHKQRSRGFASIGDHTSPDSPHSTFANLPPPPPLPAPKPGKATPPPIDPGVFRSVTHIRRLIDEASELSVRASSGLSAAALGSLRGGGSFGQNPWGGGYGLNGLNDGSNGRNVAMSATRIHRLRVLAVQKLAAAYKADEIASSVMVMQGGSVFDDIAERVLKVDPNDVDARYVHFFHEKIPSRQLAESTTTKQLDELIATQPQRLEFYRTRGIVHCFRDEYSQATKDFTHVLRESRALRKAKIAHRNNGLPSESRTKGTKKKKGKAGGGKSHGQAPPNGTSVPSVLEGPTIDGPDGEPLLLHPSVLPDAPDPIEPQCLFLRGAAYLQHAVYVIEEAILKLEDIRKAQPVDGAELRLCYIENGKYGGVEMGNPDGPLGSKDGMKLRAYKEVLANENFKDQILSLVKKSMRDHEKFLAHFDTLEGPEDEDTEKDIAQKVEIAYHLCENFRPTSHHPPPSVPDTPIKFTTYHPLLVESHFSILICQLILGDFASLVPTFSRTAMLVDGLEGYPVFLPPRSMAQAEFVEVLERLAGGWKNGIQPHSLSRETPMNGTTITTVGSTWMIEAPLPRSPKAKEVDRSITPPVSVSTTPRSHHSSFSSSSSSPDRCYHAATISSSLSSSAALFGINGSSSSSTTIRAPLSFPPSPLTNTSTVEPPSGRDTPTSGSGGGNGSDRFDLLESLDYARMLLVPVVARQREKAELTALEKVNGKNKKSGTKKSLSINIPLHGPRVEILLAWLAAVHLAELDNVA